MTNTTQMNIPTDEVDNTNEEGGTPQDVDNEEEKTSDTGGTTRTRRARKRGRRKPRPGVEVHNLWCGEDAFHDGRVPFILCTHSPSGEHMSRLNNNETSIVIRNSIKTVREEVNRNRDDDDRVALSIVNIDTSLDGHLLSHEYREGRRVLIGFVKIVSSVATNTNTNASSAATTVVAGSSTTTQETVCSLSQNIHSNLRHDRTNLHNEIIRRYVLELSCINNELPSLTLTLAQCLRDDFAKLHRIFVPRYVQVSRWRILNVACFDLRPNK